MAVEALMSAGDGYRLKAAEILACSRAQTNGGVKTELEALAAAFIRLAGHADENCKFDLAVAVPTRHESDDPKPL